MENNIKKRLLELADRSYSTNTYTFTDFLGLAEQNDFHEIEKQLSFAGYKLYGGYDNADRVMIRFGNEKDFGYDVLFEICCIHIEPLMKKFSDPLNHRDFLGALMNLGIERSTLGDIKVNENDAYVFCLTSISEYICENLSRVKHTSVKCTIINDTENISSIVDEEPEKKMITVSSLRADGVISKVYNLSRSQSIELFRQQMVFVNGRMIENNSYAVKSGDVVNVRGSGKFKISSDLYETKKGKIGVTILIW